MGFTLSIKEVINVRDQFDLIVVDWLQCVRFEGCSVQGGQRVPIYNG